MSPITHFLASWTLGDAAGCRSRDRALVAWCGLCPDLDGLGIAIDVANGVVGRASWYYGLYHHRLLHGVVAAVVLPAIMALFATQRLRMYLLGVVVIHLHLLCDLVGSRGPGVEDIWPIHYLAPLSDAWTVAWRGQWALNGWPNVLITLVLIAWSFQRAIRVGYSPVGAFSRRADRLFVVAVRSRWQTVTGNRPLNR